MTTIDTQLIADLTTRTRDLVAQLCRLIQFDQAATSTSTYLRDLDLLWNDIANLTSMVQDREARAWRSLQAARPHAPRRMPLSTEVGGAGVTKCAPGIARGLVG
ncbi:MAG: hypothetical protein HOQ29_06785 [Acidobacteria bacterium]|nr:hypothetical protein [Acidobacteriota bacterium]